MADIFDIAFTNLLGWEGGYGYNAKDPGGPTKYGVIQTEYDASRRKKGLPPQSVANITIPEAEEIYRIEYWDAIRCGELNPGVADATFDADVNSGDRRAVTWLQEAINQVSGKPGIAVDGSCGPITVANANASDPAKLIDAMLSLRLAFMHAARNPKTGAALWLTFGHGWQSRINGVRVQAQKLADAEPASAPIPSPATVTTTKEGPSQ